MKKTFKHIRTLMAAMAMGVLLAACADDDHYSIREARIDIDQTVLGQLEAYGYATPFNLVTDADAEWEATMEWDAKKNAQPAYVYPKTGTGPALLKIATFDNPTQSPRQAVLKITFPKDPSKNIVQTITQKRGADSNGSKDISYGNKTRGIGYGYNCFDGYAETACITVPILKVDQMYDDKKLLYDFSTLRVEQREESGASVDELASKLNGTMHAAASNWGLSASVDAKFSGGQKSTASNEFAWMDINATTCTASFNGPQSILIFDYMTDEAYADMNGLERWSEKKQKDIVYYPATDEGFAQLVMDYGTHLVVSGKLGGQLHTQITANTSKITTAYNVSAALEATYGGPYSIDANGKAKTQWAHAQSRNHSAFYFAYELRGGSLDDGAVTALSSVLDKMTKARQGAGTENDEVSDAELNVKIDDTSAEYQTAADAWLRSLSPKGGSADDLENALKCVVLVEFRDDSDLVPIYELVDQTLTEDEDGVDGKARYQAFKLWYETKLMTDPSIIERYKPKSGILIPPTIVNPMIDLSEADSKTSLIQDVYIDTDNGQHVARICSEFIPLINPTKRVSVIYPVVNGKTRYNLGIYCGDEVTYPYYVSWGQVEDPSTPFITPIKDTRLGGYDVAYLRGNHLTLFPDENFSNDDYLKTKTEPFKLILKDNNEDIVYPLVKINDYLYTRNLYRGRTYQNGTQQMSDKLPQGAKGVINAFSPFYRNTDPSKNIDWYLVSNYSLNLHAWGGFAPQGWTMPYYAQYKKMIDNLADIPGKKPDGTIGASFLSGGIYGLNTQATGCVIVGYPSKDKDKPERVALVNKNMLYLGALSDADRAKLEGSDNTYNMWDQLTTALNCDALAVEPATGNAAMTYYKKQAPTCLDYTQFNGEGYWPENLRNKGEWKNYKDHGDPINYIKYQYESRDKYGWPSNYLCYPVIICQKAVR